MPDTATRNEAHTAAGAGRKLRRLRHLRHETAAGIDNPYWRSTRRLAVAAVLVWAVVALVLPLASEQLDAISVLEIPLGYYLGAQGGLILVAIVMLLAARRQNRHDFAHRPASAVTPRHNAGQIAATGADTERATGGR